jgi:uncharacterized protein (TIGR02246 family)
MTFREGLEDHLSAIRRRDADALATTLPADGRILLVTADGRLVRSADEFLAMHRDWFAARTWSLDAEVVTTFESADLGVAVLGLDYRDVKPSGEPLRERSFLTLVFRRDGGKWVMVQDQNTPVRTG